MQVSLVSSARILCVLSILLGVGRLEGAVTLPSIFSDNMVLQRDKPLPVWGTAGKGEVVKVKCGEQAKSATADENGTWMVRLDPMKADKVGREMTVSGENTITFKNVVVGDVWLCAGQSNMQMTLSGAANGAAEVARAGDFPNIRFIKIAHAYTPSEPRGRDPLWQLSTPGTVWNCTAVGTFFARGLVKDLDVPVGILDNSWGGAQIERWICREGYASVPELKDYSRQLEGSIPDNDAGRKAYLDYLAKMKEWIAQSEKAVEAKQTPPPMPSAPAPFGGDLTQVFSSKESPLVPYAIRGVIWYQGEANAGDGEAYFFKLEALIGGWRQIWKQGDFPFYLVQLPNYQESDPNKPEMIAGWAKIREAQLKALTIPNTALAITIDLGDGGNIHPTNKQDVGKRMAALVLAKEYGKQGEFTGPMYQKFQVEGNKIRISFDHADGGLMVAEKKGADPVQEIADGKLKWISIAGADKKFQWAQAVIDGKTLVVSSEKVPNPVAVRYAYTANPIGPGLYNKEGFPASPFRTDDW